MPDLLQSLYDIGDSLLPLAPHNVIVSLLTGGALGPQVPVPAGVTLPRYTTITGKYRQEIWRPGGLSVRALGSGTRIKITAPQDMALVLTFQPLKRKTVEKRHVAWGGLEKVYQESDMDYLPKGGLETAIVGPGHPLSVEKVVIGKGISEEKGPFGVITWKKTTVNYGFDVSLVGVMYKETEIPVTGRGEEREAARPKQWRWTGSGWRYE